MSTTQPEIEPALQDTHDPVSDRRIRLVDLRAGQSILGIPRREGPIIPRHSLPLLARTWILSGDADEIVALLVYSSLLEEALGSSRGRAVRVTRDHASGYRLDLLQDLA